MMRVWVPVPIANRDGPESICAVNKNEEVVKQPHVSSELIEGLTTAITEHDVDGVPHCDDFLFNRWTSLELEEKHST